MSSSMSVFNESAAGFSNASAVTAAVKPSYNEMNRLVDVY